MAELRTEEEQVEALKSWWKENGKSTLLWVAVAIAGALGWKSWNQYQDNYAGGASAIYENILSPVAMGASLDDAATTSLFRLGEQLRADFGSSSYAPMGAMVLARVAVEKGDLAQAMEQLDFVLASDAAATDLKELASIRKAKLFLAEGKTGEASAALVVAAGSAYQSILLETQGDIAAAEGKATEARKLYAQAMELSDAQRKTVIKLKFDDLATGEGV